ncbi:MAG: 2,3-oxidosqualene cyclase [Methylococcaceae bacterium]|nr:2,3-oxidosqualene cyclase [Methylococcaceae bacterium]
MKKLPDDDSPNAGPASPGANLRDRVEQAARRATRHLIGLQRPAGDWEGEMVWCTMILAQTVMVRTIVERPYSDAETAEIVKHFQVTQRDDGSWGMHPESAGYVFFTTMAYVALRLLGVPADAAILARARQWLNDQPGGVREIPSWGKFWLSLLGLYEREGLNPIPPEIFLLPEWLPVHPRQFYCHTRLIYLGLGFLYGMRFCASLPGTLRDDLRRELYPEPYAAIDFATLRNRIAKSDVYVPISPALKLVYRLLELFERWHRPGLRRRALDLCFEHICYEQRHTRHQGISPVSGLLNCLALYARDPHHPDLAPSLDGLEAWRWEDEAEGIRYAGARSNSWDTAFAMQALVELSGAEGEFDAALTRGHGFLKVAQMTEELPDYPAAWRDRALGGWCFSDGQHRWPVSDCAAEALSAILSLYERSGHAAADRLDDGRLESAVEFILSRQNADGGFGTYERRRGSRLLELINPSEMYGQCMTELSYIECTGSSLAALAHYRRHHPDFADGRIGAAIRKAAAFLRNSQHADGSYAGFWGINYTYALFHAIKGLRGAGAETTDPALQAAAGWLLEKQRADGGWGEHYTGCLEGRYVEHPHSQVVMTSWALLGLLEILPPDHRAIERGVNWLVDRQQTDGAWPRQAVNGVFFGAAMLDYRLYHVYFPTWALARFTRLARAATPCGAA